MAIGEVLSGFILEGFGDNTWVAVGDHRSMVGIVRINKVINTRGGQE